MTESLSGLFSFPAEKSTTLNGQLLGLVTTMQFQLAEWTVHKILVFKT